MEHSLSLSFITSNGDKASITISDVRANLTDEEVNQLMQTIIENNTFITKNGSLVAPYSAKLISRETTTININK